jgi:hypothetical protein
MPGFLHNAWLQLLFLLSARKRKMPWGRVLNSTSGEPIAQAVVALRSQDNYGRIVERSITDKDGRFGFFVPAGHYSLWASKYGFTFPSQLPQKIYKGATFPIGKEGMIIIDLFCDPKEKVSILLHHLKRGTHFLHALRIYFLLIGLFLSLYLLWNERSLANTVFFLLYIVFWINEVRQRKMGRHTILLVDQDKKPLSFAVIRLVNQKTKQITLAKATDNHGEVYFLVPKGKYIIQVTNPVTHKTSEEMLDLPHGTPLKQKIIKVTH